MFNFIKSIFGKLLHLDLKLKSNKQTNKANIKESRDSTILQAGGDIRIGEDKTKTEFYTERSKIIQELWKRINKRHEELIDLKSDYNKDKLNQLCKKLHLTLRYFEDYSIYFSNEIKEKFRKLYFRGFQTLLTDSSPNNLRDFIDIKESLEEEFRKALIEK